MLASYPWATLARLFSLQCSEKSLASGDTPLKSVPDVKLIPQTTLCLRARNAPVYVRGNSFGQVEIECKDVRQFLPAYLSHRICSSYSVSIFSASRCCKEGGVPLACPIQNNIAYIFSSSLSSVYNKCRTMASVSVTVFFNVCASPDCRQGYVWMCILVGFLMLRTGN